MSQIVEKNIIKCRQYLVASKFILKNETLGHHNVYTKRTGTGGISPMRIPNLYGKKAKKNYKKDEKI